jgi:glycerol uptake facilitator-like aquaporin
MPKPGQSWQAAGFEAVLTFGLVLMVLNLANGPKLNGPFVPLAVGVYILAWGTMGGPYDGASTRSGLNAARISVANSSGSSQAAKWPPLPASWK